MDFIQLLLLCTGVLVFILLALWGYAYSGRYRPLVFSLLGGLYALTPLIYMIFYADGGGDPGPMYIFLMPPFLPQYITFIISSLLVALIYGRSGSYYWVYVLASALSLLIWMLIGYMSGKYLGDMHNKKRIRDFWIIFFIIVFVCVLFYWYGWYGFRLFDKL